MRERGFTQAGLLGLLRHHVDRRSSAARRAYSATVARSTCSSMAATAALAHSL